MFEEIIATFQSQDTSSIEAIKFEITAVYPCAHSEWCALDEVLTRPGMHCLRRVHLRIHTVNPSRFRSFETNHFPQFLAAAEAGLARLSARSVLIIEQISTEGSLQIPASDACPDFPIRSTHDG